MFDPSLFPAITAKSPRAFPFLLLQPNRNGLAADLRPALAVIGLHYRLVAGDEARRWDLQLKK